MNSASRRTPLSSLSVSRQSGYIGYLPESECDRCITMSDVVGRIAEYWFRSCQVCNESRHVALCKGFFLEPGLKSQV